MISSSQRFYLIFLDSPVFPKWERQFHFQDMSISIAVQWLLFVTARAYQTTRRPIPNNIIFRNNFRENVKSSYGLISTALQGVMFQKTKIFNIITWFTIMCLNGLHCRLFNIAASYSEGPASNFGPETVYPNRRVSQSRRQMQG